VTSESYRAKTAYDPAEAAAYDDKRFRSLRGRLVDWLEKRAVASALEVVPDNGHLLDLPAGTGRITQFLLEGGYQTSGADVSEAMLRVAGARLEHFANACSLCVADAERLPFQDRTFDGIVCVRLMGHVPPALRLQILSEMKRVTREWIIAVYYMSDVATDLKRAIKGVLGRAPQVWFPISRRALESEIGQAGLRIVRTIPVCRHLSEACVVLISNRPA
jgi:ubiquinone/menaquinone biosynthesis C-methylase UbiE